MAAASHAAISKKNMGELLLTKPELEGAVVALQALQEHRGPDFVSNLLAGCYVRIRRNKQPVLLVLLGLHLGPQGQPLIRIEGIAQPRGAIVLSHANPFTDPEEYEKCGRQELLQLMQELRAAGQPPGIDMAAAARAVWHKKVLLGWAAHWQEFMAEHGINKLVGDLQDSNKMAREATFLEPMPTSMPAAQQHPQPAPQQPPQPQQPQQPQQQEPAQQQPQQHVVQQLMHAVHQPMQAVQQPQQPQAGANVPQKHAQQPAAQVPQPQPMARVQAHLPAGQPLQQQIASLAVQPPQQAVPLVQQADVPAGMVHQQQQVPAADMQLHAAPYEQQQFHEQAPQPGQLAMLGHQAQQPGSPDLPPHLLQYCQAPPVMQPLLASQQPPEVQQTFVGQLPPQPPFAQQRLAHEQQQPHLHPHAYMQPQLQAAEAQLTGAPPHLQLAAQHPAPLGRARCWVPPAAQQPQQPVPMQRHPGLDSAAAHPALPPIHTRQQSMPHAPHGRQMPAHNARTGMLPLSLSGPARLMDLRSADGQLSPRRLSPRMPAGGPTFSKLHVYGLPLPATHGQVAAFFRAAYPSVHSARVVEAAGGVPHHAIVNFGAIWERDAALSKMDGSWFDGRCLAVRLPGQPLALPPQQAQQAQQAPPEFRAYVNGLPPTMDEVAAADFFRQRYPSVLGVRLWPPARDQPATSVQRGHILFAREDERDAAVREENGQILEGNKLKVELPLEEKAVLGVQSPRSPQQQRPQRPPSFNLFVDGLPPDATAESVATLFGRRYPSVTSAHLLPPTCAQLAVASAPPRRGFVHFGVQAERDAALNEMRGTFVGGQKLRTEIPWSEQQQPQPAEQPAAALAAPTPAAGSPEGAAPPPAGPQFKLLVFNVGNAMPPKQLCDYFRERYPSVLSAALRDGHGSVTFASDVERRQAKLDMDGHVLPGGRRIGTGLPPSTPAAPVPDAPAAPAAAAAAAAGQPAQPAAPAAPAVPAGPAGPLASGSGAAQSGAAGAAAGEASPAGGSAGGVASRTPQAPAVQAGQGGTASPAAPAAAAPTPAAAAAAGSAGSAAGQTPAPVAAAAAAGGTSLTSGSGQPPSAAAVALSAGLAPVQLVGWPPGAVPGGSFVLMPAAAVAAGEGQAQLVAVPGSDTSTGGLYLTPSAAQSLGVAGVLLPAQQVAAAAATAAPASSSHQHQQGSGTGPISGKQGSGQPKQQVSGAGSHPLGGKEPAKVSRQPHSRSPGRRKERSRSPRREMERSRSPVRHRERSRSPRRRQEHSERPARLGRSRSRSRERRRGAADRSRSRSRERRRSRSRSRSRGGERRRSPADRRQRRNSPRREVRHGSGPDRGLSSRQQRRSPGRSSKDHSSKDRKRQHSSPQRDADTRRQRQRTPERAQQAAAGQPAGKPASGPRSPGIVTADSPGTRLVVVRRSQRQVTPDLQPEAAAAATEAAPELFVQVAVAAAAAPELMEEEEAGTPDLASFPELDWDAAEEAEAAAVTAAEPQQQQQPQPPSQQQPVFPELLAQRPCSTAPPPAEVPLDPQPGSSMELSASPPPQPPPPPSRPASAPPPLPPSAQPSCGSELPPLPPPSRPGSTQPPLPPEPEPAAAANPAAAAGEWPGTSDAGGFAGPPGFGLHHSVPGRQGVQAADRVADPKTLDVARQPHGLPHPARLLPPPAGLEPLLRHPPVVPRVPVWVCDLFMDAARELAQSRRLPLDVRDVEVRMDRICRRKYCLREAGVTIGEVCTLLEMRQLCEVQHTARGLFIMALR